MEILSIGGLSGFGQSNTCLLRNNILKEIGRVDEVDTTSRPINLIYRICNKLFQLGLPIGVPDICGANNSIIELISKTKRYDIIWIDKGITIKRSTFKMIKELQPQAKIIGYSPDWMVARHNQSQHFLDTLKYYDCFATTKSYSVRDLELLGAKDVLFIDNAYQRGFHKIYSLTNSEKQEYTSDISFIGSWEEDRSKAIEYLAQNGIKVNIWGSGKWSEVCSRHDLLIFKGGDLQDERYCKVISASKISLCFLRKMNLDLQTTRSVEIPACGAMMMAERTSEHQKLFAENVEAVYFSSKEELLDKCRYYISNEKERSAIANAGHAKCEACDYSYGGRIRQIIKHVAGDK